jgi:tripartite-type tricarboxylate transporter receptor subunit TctC
MAKAQPGTLKFSSNGNGTPSHVMAELFQREAAIRMIHVPYKGSVAGVNALLTGDVDMTIGAAPSVAPHVQAGRLRALATAAPQRLAAFATVPTFFELGYRELRVGDWQGIVAPAGTPHDIIERLHAEIAKALHSPIVAQRLQVLGMEAAGAGPAEFAVHIRRETERWSRVIRESGIKAD